MVKKSFDLVTENKRCQEKYVAENHGDLSSPTGRSRSYSSYSAALSHILVVSLGPTMFILPKAFASVGYVNATVGIILISILYAYFVHSLLNSVAIVEKLVGRSNLSFAEVVKYAFEIGRMKTSKLCASFVYQLVNVLFVVSWGGELSFTIVFLAENLQFLLGCWWNRTTTLPIQWIISALFVPCVSLTIIPCERLAILGSVTAFIDISTFVCVVMYDLYSNSQVSNRLAHRETFNKPLEVTMPQFLATVFFTLNFTGLAIPSRNVMENPQKFESTFGVLHTSLIVITSADIAFGLSGYLRYGQEEAKESLLLNLSLNSTLLRTVLAFYCLATFFSIPFLYFVLFNVVWEGWVMKLCENTPTRHYSFRSKICVLIFTNVAVFVMVMYVPNFNMLASLGGLVCGVMDSFLIPATLEIILYPKHGSRFAFAFVLVKNIVIILMGSILFAFGLNTCTNRTTGDSSKAS